jgi:aspartate carbamoyltransferase catalytic subunit
LTTEEAAEVLTLKNKRKLDAYRINHRVLDKLPHNAIIMHPQPISSGPQSELAREFRSDPRVVIMKQSRNGLPFRMALLASILWREYFGIF